MRVCREMVGGWMDGKERGSESKGGEERAEEESYHWLALKLPLVHLYYDLM